MSLSGTCLLRYVHIDIEFNIHRHATPLVKIEPICCCILIFFVSAFVPYKKYITEVCSFRYFGFEKMLVRFRRIMDLVITLLVAPFATIVL